MLIEQTLERKRPGVKGQSALRTHERHSAIAEKGRAPAAMQGVYTPRVISLSRGEEGAASVVWLSGCRANEPWVSLLQGAARDAPQQTRVVAGFRRIVCFARFRDSAAAAPSFSPRCSSEDERPGEHIAPTPSIWASRTALCNASFA